MKNFKRKEIFISIKNSLNIPVRNPNIEGMVIEASS
jgi:hypothetical protein